MPRDIPPERVDAAERLWSQKPQEVDVGDHAGQGRTPDPPGVVAVPSDPPGKERRKTHVERHTNPRAAMRRIRRQRLLPVRHGIEQEVTGDGRAYGERSPR